MSKDSSVHRLQDAVERLGLDDELADVVKAGLAKMPEPMAETLLASLEEGLSRVASLVEENKVTEPVREPKRPRPSYPEYRGRQSEIACAQSTIVYARNIGQTAVFTKAEIIQASMTADWMILVLSFLVFTGGFHVHAMLTMGDWDFWSDWKDRRLWPTVTPIMCITFPAAVQYWMWDKLRLPLGATFTILGLLFGEWINRYFNFWGWTYFPINFVWAATLVPGAIILDVILLWSKSFLITAVVGGLSFGLIFYPGNWSMLAVLHQPVEYNGMVMTIADIQGYHYVRTGTPEYIRFVEKGTLRTFGKDVVPVSAFFSGFICILIYFIWHFFGRWYSTTRFIDQY